MMRSANYKPKAFKVESFGSPNIQGSKEPAMDERGNANYQFQVTLNADIRLREDYHNLTDEVNMLAQIQVRGGETIVFNQVITSKHHSKTRTGNKERWRWNYNIDLTEMYEGSQRPFGVYNMWKGAWAKDYSRMIRVYGQYAVDAILHWWAELLVKIVMRGH